MKLNQLWVFVLAFSLYSCGQRPQTPQALPFVNFSEVADKSELNIWNINSECDSDSTLGHIIYFADSSDSETAVERIYKIDERKILNQKIYYGGVFKSIISENKIENSVLAPPKNLKNLRCKKYKRDSINQIALNSMVSIDMAQTFLEKSLVKLNLPKIDLYIHPIHEVVRVDEDQNKISTYKSDNAGYRNNQMIYFPQSNKKKDTVRFWEVPFVTTHEFGHHIFKTLFKDGAEEGLKQIGFNFKSIELEKSKLSHYLASINEAFADIFGTLSLHKDFNSLKALGCSAIDRDIKINKFATGYTKKLTEESTLINIDNSIKSFTFNTPSNHNEFNFNLNRCNNLSFNNEHTLGAIIAHTFNTLLSQMEIQDKDKLSILVSWLERLQESFFIDQFEPDYILIGIDKFFTAVRSSQKIDSFDDKTCKYIKDSMPIAFDISGC